MKDYIIKFLTNLKERRYVSRVLILTLSLFISALVFNFFQKEANLVTGGTSGIALILHELFGWNTSDIISITMFLFLIISFIFLGIEATSGTIISSILYPFFIKLTENWPEIILVETNDLLLISIFMGIIYGITNGLVYKNGFNNGGTSVLSQLLYRYKRISIASTSFVVNMIIVILGGFIFGWNIVMYATIILYINRIVTNKIIVGTSKNKIVYIVTDNKQEVSDFIMNILSKGVTEFNAHGGFKNKSKLVLMTVINNNEYFRLKEGVKYIDKNAFLIVTDTYQASGGR